MTVAGVAKKYGAVIFFPTVAVASILADWTHTRAWKQQQLLLAKKDEFVKE
ncbi:uncharacterized protein [Eurosta solidaginis]|uniref:uncharacterized protein n=1 Tax=Eurosta solidaginis TaxID=178769 RepID=UPI0035305C76